MFDIAKMVIHTMNVSDLEEIKENLFKYQLLK